MPRSLLHAAALLLSLSVVSSCREPSGTGRRAASLALVPQFSASAASSYQTMQAAGVDADAVHITIVRPLTKEILADTIVRFPVTMASIAIEVVVELKEPEEILDATIQLKSGPVVLFSGFQQVRAIAGTTSTSGTPVAMQYVGPGATATSLVIVADVPSTYVGGHTTLTAVAADPTGITVGDALIAWSSLNGGVASVGPDGTVTGLSSGSASIVARTANGLADTMPLIVTGAPASLEVVSGTGASATVGSTVSTPFTVRVLTAERKPVPGAPVIFTPGTEGATVSSDTVVTDSLGDASTSVSVGTVAGAHVFTARLGDLPSVSIEVVAQPGAPAMLRAVAGTDSQRVVTAGTPLPIALAVQVTDSFGNPTALDGLLVDFVVTADPGAGSFAPAQTLLESVLSDLRGIATAPTYVAGTGADQVITAQSVLPANRTASTTLHVFVGPVVPNRLPGLGDGLSPILAPVEPSPIRAGRFRP